MAVLTRDRKRLECAVENRRENEIKEPYQLLKAKKSMKHMTCLVKDTNELKHDKITEAVYEKFETFKYFGNYDG